MIIDKLMDGIYKKLPEKHQQKFLDVSYRIFLSYYNLQYMIPYNRAVGKIAYFEKYLKSELFEVLRDAYGEELACQIYFDKHLWKLYSTQLTLIEKLKCVFRPFSIIKDYI